MLADYAQRYGADPAIWRFLTGPDGTIQPLLQKGFKIGSAIVEMPVTVTVAEASNDSAAASYTLLHSPYFLLVNQHGTIRQDYDGTEVNVTQILGDVSQLLRSSPSAMMEDVRMSLTVRPDPPVLGESALTVSVADQEGRPVQGARLEVRGDMAHGAMAPVLGQATSESDGRYLVPFRWTMTGDWTLDVEAALPDGHDARSQFPMKVGAGGS